MTEEALPPDKAAPSAARIGLLAILGLAAAVRLWGISTGLPYGYHEDESAIVRRALSFGTGDLNPHSFHWPAFHLYVLFGLYGLLYVVGHLIGVFASVDDFRRLYFTDPTLFFLAGRLLSVTIGTATVYVVYRIGYILGSHRAGLIAACLLAITFIHVRDSHYATLDVPATLWVSLSFLFAARILIADRPHPRWWVLAGAFAGLATATKYNAGIVVLAVASAHFLRQDRTPFRWLLASAAACIIVFALATPFVFLDWETFLRDFRFQQQHLAEGQAGLGTDSSVLYYARRLMFDQLPHTQVFLFDPIPIVALVGTVLVFRFPARRWIFVLLLPTVYLLYLGTWGMAATRYLNPIFPFLVVATGMGLSRWSGWRLGVVAFVLLITLRNVLMADWVLTRPDTRTVAKAWVESNIAPGTTLALEPDGPPLAQSAASIARRAQALAFGRLTHPTQGLNRMQMYYRWQLEAAPDLSYDLVPLQDSLLDHEQSAMNRFPVTNYDLDRLQRLGVEYVVLSSDTYARYLTPEGRKLYAAHAAFFDRLRSEARLVHEVRASGYRPGPTIRVYALPPGT